MKGFFTFGEQNFIWDVRCALSRIDCVSIVLSLNIVQIVFDFAEVGNFSLILPFLNV